MTRKAGLIGLNAWTRRLQTGRWHSSVRYTCPVTISLYLPQEATANVHLHRILTDENLDVILVLRFGRASFEHEQDATKPPHELLSFLTHLQVSYEASYITSIPQPPSPAPVDGARPGVPPRSHSMPPNRNKPSPLAPPHPSIFPPHTPHPIPSTAESDRQYVQTQGTPLRSGTWGENTAPSGSEAFALVYSKLSGCWIAVFKMNIQVGTQSWISHGLHLTNAGLI